MIWTPRRIVRPRQHMFLQSHTQHSLSTLIPRSRLRHPVPSSDTSRSCASLLFAQLSQLPFQPRPQCSAWRPTQSTTPGRCRSGTPHAQMLRSALIVSLFLMLHPHNTKVRSQPRADCSYSTQSFLSRLMATRPRRRNSLPSRPDVPGKGPGPSLLSVRS